MSESDDQIIKEKDDMEDDTASVLESMLNERRNIPWDDVAGLDEAKKTLMEIVICPLKFPHLFRGLRQPCRNILLFGAPGTGKTYLANALATEAKGFNFFSISAYDFISKYVGTSEKLVKCLFSLARDKKPSIIFIDDVDALCRESERASTARNEFLVQMYDEGNDGVFVVGATSVPWVLDPATRKCFVKRIHIPLPDMSARVRLFQLRLGTTQHSLTEEDFKELGQKTDGFTGADIHVVVGDGMMQYIRKVQKATHFKKIEGPSKTDPEVMVDDLLTPCSPDDDGAIEINWTQLDVDKLFEAVVSMADILMSLSSQKPSITNEDLKKLEDFTKDYVQM